MILIPAETKRANGILNPYPKLEASEYVDRKGAKTTKGVKLYDAEEVFKFDVANSLGFRGGKDESMAKKAVYVSLSSSSE